MAAEARLTDTRADKSEDFVLRGKSSSDQDTTSKETRSRTDTGLTPDVGVAWQRRRQ